MQRFAYAAVCRFRQCTRLRVGHEILPQNAKSARPRVSVAPHLANHMFASVRIPHPTIFVLTELVYDSTLRLYINLNLKELCDDGVDYLSSLPFSRQQKCRQQKCQYEECNRSRT